MTDPRDRVPPRAHPAADRAAPPAWTAMARILAVRPDNLGDVVLLTPALRALRAAAPHAQLDLLASPAGSALRPLLADVDGLLTVSPSWQQIDPPEDLVAGEQRLVERLTGYDAVVVFTSPTQSPWPAAHAAMLAGVPVRVVQSEEFGGGVASHWVTPSPDGTHQVDRCLHLLERVGVPPQGRAPALRVPEAARRTADAALGPLTRFALLAPGASCSSRRYPPRGFAAAAAVIADAGLPVLVTGPAAEADLVAEVVTAAAHPDVRPLPVLGVDALAAVTERAAVALTNNSGGMHLADALGTPVVVAWGGVERVGDMGPRAVPAVLFGEPVGCSPCRLFTCPYAHECMDIDPDVLASAALDLTTSRKEPTCRTPRLTAPQPVPAR